MLTDDDCPACKYGNCGMCGKSFSIAQPTAPVPAELDVRRDMLAAAPQANSLPAARLGAFFRQRLVKMDTNPVLHWTDHAGERQAWPLNKLQEEFKDFLAWRAQQPASSGEPVTENRDWCTDPDNCQRCKAPACEQHRHIHAGIRVGPQKAFASQPAPDRVPLTDDQVWQAAGTVLDDSMVKLRDVLPLARAIEAAHHITAKR